MKTEKVALDCTYKIEITKQDISDIVETAFSDPYVWSGYCTGYATTDIPKEQYIGDYIADGNTYILHDEEDDMDYSLTDTKIIMGIVNFFEDTNGYFALEDFAWIKNGKLNMVDSIVADCIIQYAVFGDIVYG